jgi:hypothetical protein
MNSPSRLSAVLAYIPIIGWIYVLAAQRRNAFAMFHLRQSIGLVLFLIGVFVGWAVIFWLLSWIPIGDIVGMVLFTLVISAYLFGIVALVLGLINAANSKVAPLPFFGQWANRLPIR